MTKVLITGATGFIGSFCADALLKSGHEIHAISTRPIPEKPNGIIWHQGSLHDYSTIKDLVATIKPEALLHLAWYVEHGLYWSSNENIKWVASSLNLVQEFINSGGRKLVCAGTCAEYDWSNEYCTSPLTENETPINPSTLYGTSKASLCATINDLVSNKEIVFSWGRLFFPYGPKETPKRLIPSTISSLIARKVVTCNNPEIARDFIFIEDVAFIFKTLVENEISGPLNIGSGKAVELIEVVKLIANELNAINLVETKEVVKNTNEPAKLVASVDQLKKNILTLPETSLLTGIKTTISWWQNNLQSL